MPVIIFDLDDTLFEEITFVKSGFRAVAAHLHKTENIDPAVSFEQMCGILALYGRGQVFDKMLAMHKCYSKRMADQCIRVYRSHDPIIELAVDAVHCLRRLSNYPLYIVTDGNKLVQHRKIRALGLQDNAFIRRCFITRRFGIHNEKPSPYCFQKICSLEKISPSQVIYIGDNPNKDFVGIKPLGFQTFRILRGGYASLQMPEQYEADRKVNDLNEFADIITNRVKA